jgi:hypothetical protein
VLQDLGEAGLADVIVRLIDAGGAILDEDVSDSQGRYQLAPPSAGPFSLEVVLPNGHQPTLVDVGPDDAIDSDLDLDDVETGSVETTGRVAFEHAGGEEVDLDVGLIAVPHEPSTTQTTTTETPPTTQRPPTTTETTTTAPPTTTATPTTTETTTTTVPPTTAAEPTVPPTQPPVTAAAATSSGPAG